MRVAIHHEPNIAWQAKRVDYFSAGLDALGIDHSITSSRTRVADVAILFGTTCWRHIETDGGKWMLVDRASFGDSEFVQLVWNGHGRRGDHMVPKNKGDRAALIGPELQPWRTGSRVVLCGQTEPYSPDYFRMEEWYSEAIKERKPTHFRKHPVGVNPTTLPLVTDWNDVGLAITLNSSIAVDAVIAGIPIVVDDFGGMADEARYNRRRWLEWLCWTQWSWTEIKAGEPIRHLFRKI